MKSPHETGKMHASKIRRQNCKFSFQERKAPTASRTGNIIFSDGVARLTGTGRCDDGIDGGIASTKLAEAAVRKGIGNFRAMTPVKKEVAFNITENCQELTLSRSCVVPCTFLQVSLGQLWRTDIGFLVVEKSIASE